MVDETNSLLRVNASGVIVLEVVSRVDAARDWTVLEFSFHLVGSLDLEVLADVVGSVVHCRAVLDAALTYSWGRSDTIAADINILAHSVLEVQGDVVHARCVLQAGGICPLVNLCWISSIAGSSCLAIDDDLGVEANWGSLLASHTIHDVESISDSRCGTLCPARAAVLRDMLVLIPGEIVYSVLVSPVDWCHILGSKELP